MKWVGPHDPIEATAHMNNNECSGINKKCPFSVNNYHARALNNKYYYLNNERKVNNNITKKHACTVNKI